MRKYYRELVVTESQKTTSTSAPQPQTLGPAQ